MSRTGGDPTFGDTWVYESLVGGIPGLQLTTPQAIAVQFVGFETLVLGLAIVYDLPTAAVSAGTIAVVVAAGGSVAMRHIGTAARELDLPAAYRRLLFGSSVEVVFGVLAFVASVTYLLVAPGSDGSTPLVTLFGRQPPAPVAFVALLILWDLCYRIGTSWWTALVSLWRSLRFRVDAETARRCRRIDAANVGFALLELGLLPIVWGNASLVGALVGHVAAVTTVSIGAELLTKEAAAGH
ncbi:MAG: hypothetical protein ABEJ73_04490 [Haloplanus sp.]